MKMNKKGFTLIELLAVIVILAIIALIATPIIMGIIDDAQTQSAKNSAYGYLDSVDKSLVQSSFKKISNPTTAQIDVLDGDYVTASNGKVLNIDGTTTKVMDVEFKGEGPEDGSLLCYTNGKIEANSRITVNGKTFYTNENGELTETKPATLCNVNSNTNS